MYDSTNAVCSKPPASSPILNSVWISLKTPRKRKEFFFEFSFNIQVKSIAHIDRRDVVEKPKKNVHEVNYSYSWAISKFLAIKVAV